MKVIEHKKVIKKAISIKIEISKIVVEQYYFSFRYRYKVGNKKRESGRYSSSHVWGEDKKGFMECLVKDYAVELVLEIVMSNNYAD